MYVLGRWGDYKNNLVDIIMVQKGGLAILGGFGLTFLVLILLARRRRIPVLRLFDAIAPGLALGYAIGRIGCFLNGCCFGVPTNLPWGLVFPLGSLAAQTFPDVHIHPTQTYASLSMLTS